MGGGGGDGIGVVNGGGQAGCCTTPPKTRSGADVEALSRSGTLTRIRSRSAAMSNALPTAAQSTGAPSVIVMVTMEAKIVGAMPLRATDAARLGNGPCWRAAVKVACVVANGTSRVSTALAMERSRTTVGASVCCAPLCSLRARNSANGNVMSQRSEKPPVPHTLEASALST
jgi:hypothetical protein